MDLTTICNKKICFIISHHDDETLFFGGLLNILHDKNEITIIVVVDIEHENVNYIFERKRRNFDSIIKLLNVNVIEMKENNYRETIDNTESLNIEYTNLVSKMINYNLENFDIFFTHNDQGEYGHLHHKLVNTIVQKLKKQILTNKLVFTTTNKETDIKVKINKEFKHQLIKMYDFKDNEQTKHVWFKQCLKLYSFWGDNDYEYFKIMN